MLGLAVGMQPQYSTRVAVPFPAGFAWDQGRFGFEVTKTGNSYATDLDPRAQVDPALASDRLHRLQALLNDQQQEIQQSMVGREVSVLLEKPGRLPGQMVGKSEYLHAVHIADPGLEAGQIVQTRIATNAPNSLGGVLV